MVEGLWDSSEITAKVRRFIEEQIPFNAYLGIKVMELSEGRAVLEVPFRNELIGDPFRPALHGGVLSAVLDTAGGAAAFTRIGFPRDRISTIDLRIDYLEPGELKTIVAEAIVMRMGNRVASTDARCFHPDEPDRWIATAKAVYNVRRSQD